VEDPLVKVGARNAGEKALTKLKAATRPLEFSARLAETFARAFVVSVSISFEIPSNFLSSKK
jgi:hypothetical protein